MEAGNLFVPHVPQSANEDFEDLARGREFTLQRIVSTGQTTPPGEWYDQDTEEWVVLLAGAAVLRFADRDELMTLKPGDHIRIPAHCRHRVEHTADAEETVWLALHYRP